MEEPIYEEMQLVGSNAADRSFTLTLSAEGYDGTDGFIYEEIQPLLPEGSKPLKEFGNPYDHQLACVVDVIDVVSTGWGEQEWG